MFYKAVNIYLYIYLVNLEISWSKLSITHKFDDIEALSNSFDISHPYIIRKSDLDNVRILKYLSQANQIVRISEHLKKIPTAHEQIQNIIIDVDYNGPTLLQYIQPLLNDRICIILSLQNHQFNEMYNKLNVKINQKVYLFKSSTKEVYETYNINDIHIKRKLGQIYLNNTFMWDNNVNSNFIKRRSNFQGLTLKGMVEFVPGLMQADADYTKKAKYNSNNETYFMNGYQSGLFDEVLQILQSRLNFSTLLYKRKEVAWGYIYPLSNGSFHGTGQTISIHF